MHGHRMSDIYFTVPPTPRAYNKEAFKVHTMCGCKTKSFPFPLVQYHCCLVFRCLCRPREIGTNPSCEIIGRKPIKPGLYSITDNQGLPPHDQATYFPEL